MKFARLLGIAVLVFAQTYPAQVLAQSSHANSHSESNSSENGNGNGQGNGNGNGNGQGNDNGQSNDNGNGGSDSGNTGNGNGNGQGNGNGNSQGNGAGIGGTVTTPELPGGTVTVPATPATPAPTTDQDAALDAVKSGEAVPLEDIVDNVRKTVGGDVLDAHQFTYQGFLLYEIKVLQPGGQVKRVYYYAKSGRPVGQ